MEKIWLSSYPDSVPHEIDVNAYKSVNEVFEESFEEFGDNPAFFNIKRHMTYKELDTYSQQFANYLLHDLGLTKGDKVAIMMPNCLQYPVALIGTLRAGLIVSNVNPLYTARELKHQLNDSGSTTIVVVENFAHTLETVVKDTPVKTVITTQLADMQRQPWRTTVNFLLKHVKKMVPKFHLPDAVKFNDALKAGAKHTFTKQEVTGEDIAFLQYTGGTTGVSKGAILTHENMIANLMQIDSWTKPRLGEVEGEDLIMISPLPMYHIFCMTVNILGFMKLGGLNVLISNPRDTQMFIKIMSKFKFHGISCVNTLFNSLLHHPDFTKCDFSNLKIAVGGGAAIQQSVAEQWFKVTGQPILEGYGMTETSPLVSTSPVIDIPVYAGNIGVPMPSTDCSIRNEEGEELPIGEVGELCVKGPQVMRGYWNKPDETNETFTKDGYLRTGDIAVMNEKGVMKLVDRKKDMILVSGFNVFPNEIENVLAMHDKIVEAAAIGVEDERTGEAVKVFIVKQPDQELSKKEIIAFCKENLTGYKVPRQIEFMDELPKSPVGKILRKDLR